MIKAYISRFSVRKKFLIVLLGTTLFFGLSMILFAKTVIYKKLFSKIQEKGAVMAKETASACINPVVTEELFEIEMMFKDMMASEKDIVYLFVTDKDNRVLAHTFAGGFPDELKTAHEVNPLRQYSVKELTTDKGTILDFGVPLLKGEIGVLHMGLSESSIRRDVNGIVMLIILFSLFVMIAAGIVATIFSNVITRPIMKLAGAAAAFGRGELSQDVLITSDDEIGELVKVFNVMVINRKRAEEDITESHKRLLTVLNGLDATVYVTDIKTHELLFVNNCIKDVFGDIVGQLCWKTIQAGQTGPCAFCTNDKLVDAAGNPAGIYRWEFKNTVTSRWYDVRDRALLWVDGRIVRLEIATDITERKQAEAEVLRSLKEKEVMLQEIHHRVKNNLQVILSLLSLQAEGIADRPVRAMFEESRNRIKSMALVHEKLYESKDMAHVDFKTYLQGLVSGIANTYKRDDVVCSVEMEPVALNVNVGIPCGLIVNELVSNSLKYAFPEGKKGTIKVGINKNTDSAYVLTVADNGIGFPEETDFRNTSSLGLLLVNVLTRQILGTIELSREEGTRFSITFPGTLNNRSEENR
jgi:two-component sensor histidine kinase/HAMP domain-containing protein